MTTLKNIPDKIFQEQVRLLYANTMIMIIVSVLASFLLCWSLRTIIEQTVLFTWFSVFLTISIVRIFLLLLFNKRAPSYDSTKHSYLVFLIGTLTLIEYVSGINLGIDQLFMEHYIGVKTSHPGRMAPNTALCFSLTGLLLWIGAARQRSSRRLAYWRMRRYCVCAHWAAVRAHTRRRYSR